jgi:hypothetical protein
VAAREPRPLVLRLVAAFRPELGQVTEEALEDAIGALGPDGIERIRAAGATLGKVLDVLEARRAERKVPTPTESRRGR